MDRIIYKMQDIIIESLTSDLPKEKLIVAFENETLL